MKQKVAPLVLSMALSSGIAFSAQETKNLDIKAQGLETALMEFSRQTGIQVLFSESQVSRYKVAAVSGRADPEDVLQRYLQDTGLAFNYTGTNTVVIVNGEDARAGDDSIMRNDSEKELEIEDIIVTASRREQNLQDTPMSISSINPDSYKEAGLTSLSDIISYAPGFDFQPIGVGRRGAGTITARGLRQYGSVPVVGMYFDDVPLTGNSSRGQTRTFVDAILVDVERIEFLSGPQGTLYGSTSVGGAVKYITRKPSLNDFRGDIASDISSTKDGSINKLYSGRVSVPVVENRVGITLSGYYEDNAGFIDRVDASSGAVIEEDINAAESKGFSGDFYFKITDKLDFRANAFYQETDIGYIGGVRLAPGTGNELLFGSLSTTGVPAPNPTDNLVYAATFEYDFGWGTLTSTSSYAELNGLTRYDLTTTAGGYYANLTDTAEGNPPGTTTFVPFDAGLGYDKFTQEIRLVSTDNNQVEWIVGLLYDDEDSSEKQVVTAYPTEFNVFDFDVSGYYQEYAVFGDVTWYLTPHLDFTVGARISSSKTSFNTTTTGVLLPEGVDSALESKATVDTYLFGLRYRPTEEMSLYGRVASGYRGPSTSVVPVDPATGDLLVNPFVDADMVWNYEVGAKGKLFDNLASYNLSVWFIEWDNFQAPLVINGIGLIVNAEDGITSKGIDATFNLNPLDGLTLTSTISYSNSTVNQDEISISAVAGQHLPDVPEWSATFRARYNFMLASDMEAYISGGVKYTDGSSADFDMAYVPNPQSLVVDLNAGVRKGLFDLGLYVTNLTNEKFRTITSRATPATGEAVPYVPRTVGLRASISF